METTRTEILKLLEGMSTNEAYMLLNELASTIRIYSIVKLNP